MEYRVYQRDGVIDRRYSHNAPVFNWRLDMAVTVKLVRYKICVGGERNN